MARLIQSEIGKPKEPIVNEIDWNEWTEKINHSLLMKVCSDLC